MVPATKPLNAPLTVTAASRVGRRRIGAAGDEIDHVVVHEFGARDHWHPRRVADRQAVRQPHGDPSAGRHDDLGIFESRCGLTACLADPRPGRAGIEGLQQPEGRSDHDVLRVGRDRRPAGRRTDIDRSPARARPTPRRPNETTTTTTQELGRQTHRYLSSSGRTPGGNWRRFRGTRGRSRLGAARISPRSRCPRCRSTARW